MKFPALLTTVVLATSSVLFAEEPAPASPPAAAGGAAKPAAKAPLASNDKRFMKENLDALYLVMDLIGEAKTSATSDAVKKLDDKVKPDLDKIWGALLQVATDNGEVAPKELKGGDKSAVDRLKKGDKKNFDKEFLKMTSKEVKKMAHSFKDDKSLVNPDLKKVATDWSAVMTGYETEWDNAEKEVAKAKP